MSTSSKILSGEELEAFLDRLDDERANGAELFGDELRERLRAQPLRAENLTAISRLFFLWMQTKDYSAAQRLLDEGGAVVIAAAEPAKRARLQAHMIFLSLNVMIEGEDAEGIRALLAQLRTLVTPDANLDGYPDPYILNRLEGMEPDIAIEAIELAQLLRKNNDQPFPVHELVDLHCRRAGVFSRAQRRQEAQEEARAAFDALSNAGADAKNTTDKWLMLADRLIETVPEMLSDFQVKLRGMTADQSQPRRREMEIRLVRLSARALHARGDLEGALRACDACRHALGFGGQDDFVADEARWLIEAGRMDEAGRCVFFHVYRLISAASFDMLDLVRGRLLEEKGDPFWWLLCVMSLSRDSDAFSSMLWWSREGEEPGSAENSLQRRLFGGLLNPDEAELPDRMVAEIFAKARAFAAERSPDHPWLHRLAIEADGKSGAISASDCEARLLRLMKQEGMNDARTATALFVARAKAHGLRRALNLPLPVMLVGGLDFYEHAQAVEDYCLDAPDDEYDAFESSLQKQLTTLYERGRERFEHFFEKGEGGYHDASPGAYASLCLELGKQYGHRLQHREALKVLHCGMLTQPMAEHYEEAVSAHVMLGEEEEAVAAAEELWAFTQANDVWCDHNDYMTDVAGALAALDRHGEILIWLDRHVTWKRAFSTEQHEPLDDEDIETRMVMAEHLAEEFPDEALSIWRGVERRVKQSESWSVWERAGDLLSALERDSEADACFRKSEALKTEDPDYVEPGWLETARIWLAALPSIGRDIWRLIRK